MEVGAIVLFTDIDCVLCATRGMRSMGLVINMQCARCCCCCDAAARCVSVCALLLANAETQGIAIYVSYSSGDLWTHTKRTAQHSNRIPPRLPHPPPPFRCRRVGEIELQSKLICFFFDIQKYKYECYQSHFFLVGVLHKCQRFLLNHVNISTFVSQNNTMSTNNRNNLQVRVGIGICINCSLRYEHCGWFCASGWLPLGA